MDYITILKNLDISSGTKTQFEIFKSCLNSLFKVLGKSSIDEILSLNLPLFKILENFNVEEKEFVDNFILKNTITIEECQLLVQKEIPEIKRKELAAYFTDNKGLSLINSLLKQYIKDDGQKSYIICDPFMGAARTLVQSIDSLGVEKIKRVVGIEPYFLSAFVGFTSLLIKMKGDLSSIDVYYGDSFDIIPKIFSTLSGKSYPKIDIILTNPPFTRWKNIKNKKNLEQFTKNFGYSNLITRKGMGLQIYSLFLCDYILKKNGLLISVLPLSTFYTNGGKAYKTLLNSKYSVYGLIESNSEASFSEDSGFKEIIIISKKEKKEIKTLFTNLNGNFQDISSKILLRNEGNDENLYDLASLPKYIDNNWTVLFSRHEIKDMVINTINNGLKNGRFGYWEEVIGNKYLVRGFEMYGPDFFFVPNKYWKKIGENEESITIQNETIDKILEISKKYLVKSLTKPGLYYRKIIPEVDTYCLSIPRLSIKELPVALKQYIEWGIESKIPKPAIEAFGEFWYSHINKCLETKRPFGYLFIGDKVDLGFKTRSVFANYSPVLMSASKNFYLLKESDKETSKCIAAWFNSSLFIAIIVLFSRKISNTWTRLLRDDYIQLPIINIKKFDKQSIEEINNAFDKLIEEQSLPTLWEQFNKQMRLDLDLVISKALGLDNPEKFTKLLHKNLLLYKNTLES